MDIFCREAGALVSRSLCAKFKPKQNSEWIKNSNFVLVWKQIYLSQNIYVHMFEISLIYTFYTTQLEHEDWNLFMDDSEVLELIRLNTTPTPDSTISIIWLISLTVYDKWRERLYS